MAILDNRVKTPKIVGKLTGFVFKYVLIVLIIATILLIQIFKKLDKIISNFLFILRNLSTKF